MASLQTLREEVEAFCHARAQALLEEATGQRAVAELGRVDDRHPAVVSFETVEALQTALDSGRTAEAQRPRLAALLPFVSRMAVEARGRGEDDAHARLRQAAEVSAAGTTAPLASAWARVAEEPDRARRTALARAAEEVELRLLLPRQRRWEAWRGAAEGLPAPAQAALTEPVPEATLEAQAREFLRTSEDAWRDVLAYACQRLEPELRPLPRGEAQFSDLLHLSASPLPGAYPPAERLPALRRWLAECGLPLEAGGQLQLLEGRADAPSQPTALAVDIPSRLFLLTPGGSAGHGAFPALLDAAGRARALAAVAVDTPLEARRLGDAAVSAAAGWLFRGVTRSAPWLHRYLGHSRARAREVARLSALAQLGELRMLAAGLPLVRAFWASGLTASGLARLAAATSEALFLPVSAGHLLPRVAGWPREAEGLRAAALAARVAAQADERFDAEDFRNPAAARWLAQLWARGMALDASALAVELSGAPLSLVDVSSQLLAALGA
jgi:hypothetical protein